VRRSVRRTLLFGKVARCWDSLRADDANGKDGLCVRQEKYLSNSVNYLTEVGHHLAYDLPYLLGEMPLLKIWTVNGVGAGRGGND
jgi:hypothetical protein